MFRSVEEVLKMASQPITAPFPSVAEKKQTKQMNKLKDTAGGGWFDMPTIKMTPQLEKDLKLLSMRNALDPHHHYKTGEKVGAKSKKPFLVGTIVEGAGEFYSSRLTKKERKATLVETLLNDEQKRSMFKNKYLKLQQKNQSGSRKSYKQQRQKRLSGTKKGSIVKQERYKK